MPFLCVVRSIHAGRAAGVVVRNEACPRLIGNEIWGNGYGGGVMILSSADPVLTHNVIRDHAGVDGTGVWVAASARGRGDVGPGNVFARNAAGDVVREEGEEDEEGDDGGEA